VQDLKTIKQKTLKERKETRAIVTCFWLDNKNVAEEASSTAMQCASYYCCCCCYHV